MIETLLIFILGLIPSILALRITRQAEAKLRDQLKAVMDAVAISRHRSTWLAQEQCPMGIGDVSCRFNAHSAYLRCAVNPLGPCQDCSHYQPGTGTIFYDRPS